VYPRNKHTDDLKANLFLLYVLTRG